MIQEVLLVASLALIYALVLIWDRPKKKKDYVYYKTKDRGNHLRWK